MLFKITYWPGTADMPGDLVAKLPQWHLDAIARVWECEFKTYLDAVHASGAKLSGTSDGCFIEPQQSQLRPCKFCKADFLRQRNKIYCSIECRKEAAKRRLQ